LTGKKQELGRGGEREGLRSRKGHSLVRRKKRERKRGENRVGEKNSLSVCKRRTGIKTKKRRNNSREKRPVPEKKAKTG